MARWQRPRVHKACPDCGRQMYCDPNRVRCQSCAELRQRDQNRRNSKKYIQRRCRLCNLARTSVDSTGQCRRCRTPSSCPDCGHALLKTRAKKYFPCSHCTYVSTVSEALWENQTAILGPWNGYLEPLQIVCYVCNQESETRASLVLKGTRPCSFCSGSMISPRDVARVAARARIEPLTDAPPRSEVPWPCICLVCKSQIDVWWDGVRAGRKACIYCSRQRLRDGQPETFVGLLGLEPLEPFPGARQPWKCRCLYCGNTVNPRYDNLKSGSSASACGCQQKVTGFRNSSPGMTYLFSNRSRSFAKYGITNTDGSRDGIIRLRYLEKFGLTLIHAMEFNRGQAARRTETRLFGWIRDELSLPFAVSSERLPSGFTETFSLRELTLRQVKYRLTLYGHQEGGRTWSDLRAYQARNGH